MLSGIPTMPSTGEFAGPPETWSSRSSAEARDAFVRQVLQEEPVKPGEYEYSNAGFVVLGYMAERASGKSWEELTDDLLFKPLNMAKAGFGWPATEARPDQPYGHLGNTVQEIDGWVLGEINYAGPAGNIHCSIEDLAKFVMLHLKGLKGDNSLLQTKTIQRLHTPVFAGHRYAGGWGSSYTDEGEVLYGHFGSSGTFLSMVAIYPESDLGIVAAANCGQVATPCFRKMRDAVHSRMKDGASETTDNKKR